MSITVGVLALQGGFIEHISMLERAAAQLINSGATTTTVNATTVRTPTELSICDALIIPGGESTTMALVASQSGLMEPLREFVRVKKKATWGTCAGLVLLSRESTGNKIGGQELIGGLDVRVHRNHFGRQKESFVADVHIPLLESERDSMPFPGVFIRAPVVEALLPHGSDDTSSSSDVQVLASIPEPAKSASQDSTGKEDIVAVRQENVLGTSFHPELTSDVRLHTWWLRQVIHRVEE